MEICKICGREFKIRGLFCHISTIHKDIILKEYYDLYYKKENEGLCLYCKQPTILKNYTKGYSEYCKDCGKHHSVFDWNYWCIFHGYTEFDAKVKAKECVPINNLENFIKRFGDAGEEKFKIFSDKAAKQFEQTRNTYGSRTFSRFCVEYWIRKGFTEEESTLKISEIQKENNILFKDKKEKNPELYIGMYNSSLEYWINLGFTEEEAKLKLSERQSTFSKEKCIEKYGEDDGVVRWQERQDKWQNTLQSRDDYSDIVIRRTVSFGYSKISQEFFWELYNNISDYIKQLTYFKELNHEIGDYSKELKIGFLYDFIIKNRICIEFNGDLWHANPNIYKETDIPTPWAGNKTALEIWNKDKIKVDLLTQKGYSVYVVWESEYKNNKQKIIDTYLHIINEEFKKC